MEEVWRRFGDTDLTLRVPFLIRAQDAALSAQYANTIPSYVAQISPLIWEQGLRTEEIRELIADIGHHLLRPRPWPRREADIYKAAFRTRRKRSARKLPVEEYVAEYEQEEVLALEAESKPYISLLARMTKHELRTVASDDTGPEDTRRGLAIELFEHVGLLPDRRGGPKTKLTPAQVYQLYQEALDIVREVQDWDPQKEAEAAIIEVAREDPVEQFTQLDCERAKRKLVKPELVARLRRLRFPFLLRREHEIIDGTLTSPSGPTTMEGIARRLVMERLPGFDPESAPDESTFQGEYLTPGKKELEELLRLARPRPSTP